MILILSVFLAACGGKGNDAGSSKDGENATQDLRININTEPPTLHPGLADRFNIRNSSSSSTLKD